MIRSLHQPGMRVCTLAILLVLAAWPMALPITPAHAMAARAARAMDAPGATLFASGFEDGDPQPTWTNTSDSVAGGVSNIGGVCCGLTEPEVGVRHETAHGGAAALMYSGLATATGSFAYDEVFDLGARDITVDPTTTLSYWIYPQSGATAPVPVAGSNSACVAVDLVFTDGGTLRDASVADQNGAPLSAAAQCGHLTLDTWNHVVVVLGAQLAGKTIARLDVDYAQPANVGGYRGYIDDISITSTATASPAGVPSSGATGNGCAITPDQAQAEYNLFTLLNKHRADAGANPLTLDETLSVASRDHSCDMFQHQNMSHTGSDGSSPWQRIAAVGVTFGAAAENIGATWGYALTDGVDAIDSGMMSEPLTPGDHHANIVSSTYTRVGIGIIYANSQVWLTEDFVN